MKLGARVLKTGVAIVFALFVAELLNVPSPVFAGIAAIFAIQPSIYRSYLTILEQLQGNLIGAAIAIIFVLLFGHHIVAIGFAAIIVIALMMKLKLEKGITLAIVTLIVIMTLDSNDFMAFALIRFGTVMIGVFAAFIVNLVFIPPKYEIKLFKSINLLQDDIIRWTRLAARQASEHTSTKTAIKKIESRMDEVVTMYGFFMEDRGSYFKKERYIKARKLVLYRQMITTSKKSLELLQRLHKHENELVKLPDKFQRLIHERLDGLLTYHEQLLLKYTGKLKPEHSKWTTRDEYIQGYEMMDIFIEHINRTKSEGTCEEFSSYHLLYILSRLLDYEENLEHLDTLIVSYESHHHTEKNIDLEQEFY